MHIWDNLTVEERRALKQLQKMSNITMKVADKGSTIVVQSRKQYVEEDLKQLADPKFHTKLKHDTMGTHQNQMNDFITTMFQNCAIDFTVYDYLIDRESRTPTCILYLRPKFHKGEDATSRQTHCVCC